MRWYVWLMVLLAWVGVGDTARAAGKTIGVFVALCDNEHQGIVKVPAAIGNGEDPEQNLYWGSGEGFKTVFDRSANWKLVSHKDEADGDVLRSRIYEAKEGQTRLEARAYRGQAIKKCLQDYEEAVRIGKYDLVVFVGHNGLMDFELPAVQKAKDQAKRPDCMVLCCKSQEYFEKRLATAGGRPVLLTTQLMYPGSFLVEAGLKEWLAGGTVGTIREKAGAAYAKNQKITPQGALRVFAEIR